MRRPKSTSTVETCNKLLQSSYPLKAEGSRKFGERVLPGVNFLWVAASSAVLPLQIRVRQTCTRLGSRDCSPLGKETDSMRRAAA
jgi:hypothetical protein